MLAAIAEHATVRPAIDKRVLQLVHGELHAGIEQAGELVGAEVGHAEQADFPRALQIASTKAASMAPGMFQSHQKNCTRSSRSTLGGAASDR